MAIKFLNTIAVDTDVLYVDASNNRVGIGTTSPAATLEIYNISSTSDGDGSASETLSGQDSILLQAPTGVNEETNGSITWRNGNRRRAMITSVSENADGDYKGISFYTQGTDGPGDIFESMRIAHSGNVGIGTTSPSEKLDVVGRVRGERFRTTTGGSASFAAYYFLGDSDTGTFQPTNNTFGITTAGSERMRITSSGNVGINKTAPAAKFHVNGSTIITLPSTANFFKIEGDVDNNLFYAKNDSIGIGTTSPSEKLEVAGNARITGDVTLSNGNALRWTSDDVRIEGTTAGDNIKFYVANTEILQLAQSGTLATVTGNLRVTGAYYDSSNSSGTSGQVLSSTATGTDWVSLSEISGVDGTGTANYVAKWSDADTITNSVIYDNGTNVGIGTTSPAVRLDFGNATGKAFHLYTNASDYYGFNMLQYDSGPFSTNIFAGNGGEIKLRTVSGGNAQLTRLTVKAAGNVGIGTTSPNRLLTVQTSGTGSYLALNSSSNNTTIGSDVNGAFIVYDDTAAAYRMVIKPTTGNVGIGTTSPSAKLQIVTSSGQEGIIINNSNGIQTFQLGHLTSNDSYFQMKNNSNVTEVLFRTDNGSSYINTGNVGIGTTSPSEKLEVSGNILIDSIGQELQFSNHSVGAYRDGSNRLMISGYGGIRFQAEAVGGMENQATRMVINPSGNVGIGVNSPSSKLHVNSGAENTVALFESADARSRIVLKDNSGEGQLNALGDNITFATSSSATERMRITSSGNVGIGTTSPNEKLEVAGNVKLDGDNRHIYFGGNNTFIGERSNSKELELRGGGNSSAQTVYIDNTGNLGIGTSNPVQKLHVTGNARVTGAYYDSNNLPGTSGQVLSSTATGTDWVSLSEISGVDGTGTANYLAKWSDTDTITDSVIYDNGTNVGIGTTSPSQKLHVYGKIKLEEANGGTLLSGNYGYFRVSPTNNYGVLVENNLDAAKYFSFGVPGDYGQIRYKENTSSAISVSATGVGIGTTSPTRRLTVNGNANVFDSLFVNSNTPTTDATTDAELVIQAKGNQAGTIRSSQWYFQTIPDSIYGNSAFRIAKNYDGGATSEFMRINSSGNVGIGTTGPQSKLHVLGTTTLPSPGADGGAAVFGNTTSTGYGLVLGTETSGKSYIQSQRNDGTATTYDLLVQPNGGNVGIGTTSPGEKLDVAGNIQLNGNYLKLNEGTNAESRIVSSGNYLEFIGNGPSVVSGARIWLGKGGNVDAGFYVNASQLFFRGLDSSTKMYINGTSGNVGIGTTSPSAKLEVSDNNTIKTAIHIDNTSTGGNRWDIASIGSGVSGRVGNLQIRNDSDTLNIVEITSAGNVGIATTEPKSKLQVDGGVQMADDTDAASASKVGTLRYRTSGNNSYVDMCMQTGATTYEWVNIVQNNW